MTGRIVRLISGLMVMLMVTPAAVLAQAPPPPGSPIGDLLVMAGETLTLSGRSDHVWGNITVEPGATLVVTASTLYMESDGAWISLAQGGALRLTAGGAIKDSPTDTDDGSAADFAYSITAAAGASIESEGSSLEGASRIDAMDASVELVGSVVRMSRGPITLSGMSVLRAVNSSLVQGISPAIAVEGSSQARVGGGKVRGVDGRGGARPEPRSVCELHGFEPRLCPVGHLRTRDARQHGYARHGDGCHGRHDGDGRNDGPHDDAGAGRGLGRLQRRRPRRRCPHLGAGDGLLDALSPCARRGEG